MHSFHYLMPLIFFIIPCYCLFFSISESSIIFLYLSFFRFIFQIFYASFSYFYVSCIIRYQKYALV